MQPDDAILSPEFERYLASLPLSQQLCLLGREVELREEIIEQRRMTGRPPGEAVHELEQLQARVRSISERLGAADGLGIKPTKEQP